MDVGLSPKPLLAFMQYWSNLLWDPGLSPGRGKGHELKKVNLARHLEFLS